MAARALRDRAGRAPTLAEALDPRANSLNALRLAFAVAVIVSHAWPLGGFGPDPKIGDITVGTWAVAGFFVISGYLISVSRRRTDLLPYFGRRFLRIFPGLWVCLMVIVLFFVPLAAIKEPSTFPPQLKSVLAFVLGRGLLASHNYGIDGTLVTVPWAGSWDGSLWTLFYEVGWYVIIGAALSIAFVRRTPWAITGAFVVVAALHILDVERGVLGAGRLSPLDELGVYFLAGALLQAWAHRVPLTNTLAVLSGAVLAGSVLLDHATLVAALPFAYLCLWFGIKLPLQRVGRKNDISYGVYIYAWPVQQLLVLYGVAALGLVAYIGFSILATIPLAALSWVLVERRALKYKSRRPARVPEATLPRRAQLAAEEADA
jgi:peptidoglycan/LPS O-acetylase OafA/YrhL